MQTAHHRPDGYIQHLGNVTVGEFLEIDKRNHLALLDRQAGDSPAHPAYNLQLAAVAERPALVARQLLVELFVRLARTQMAPPVVIEDTVQPCEQARFVAQLAPVQDAAGHGFLDQIVSQHLIAAPGQGDAVQPVACLGNLALERQRGCGRILVHVSG